MYRLALLAAAATLAVTAQTKKIVVTNLSPSEVRELQSVSPDVKVVLTGKETLLKDAADADAIFGTINPELFRAAKKLKWVQVYSAGVENYRFPEFLNSGVVLTNAKIIQGPNIADHAMAMLLALTRDLHRIIPNRTREQWTRGQHKPVELRGKTGVVIGLGGIGSQIAQRAHGFGMEIVGVDPKDVPYMPFVSTVVRPDRLDTVLPRADVVFVSAPLTPESQNMMGERQFDLMKQNSYFIAVSRGRLYDTNALVKALDSRRLSGAGLDVTNPEPLPPGHPLWKFENVIITPHIAGQSDNVQRRRIDLLKDNVARFAKGEPLLNVVDKQKGY
jgi:phosphoglycerate dehydrogenase-like enzyme